MAAVACSEIKDLSAEHAPISDFLSLSGDSWPPGPAEVKKYSLTEEQLEQYEMDGFLSHVKVLSTAQIERLQKDLAEIMDPKNPAHKLWHEFNENEAGDDSGQHLFHSLGAWRISPSFHDLLFHPGVLVPAAQVLKRREGLVLWHDQIFSKRPKDGGVVAWHQDRSYWQRVKPGHQLTVRVVLDDEDASNGAIQYVPGSHTWPLLPITSKHFNDMDSIKKVLDEKQLAQFESRRALIEGRQGECTMHHPLTVHGSDKNSSDKYRRAVVVNLTSADTVCDVEGQALLDGLPVLAKGARLQGQFFPPLVPAAVAQAAIGATTGGAGAGAGVTDGALSGSKRSRDEDEAAARAPASNSSSSSGGEGPAAAGIAAAAVSSPAKKARTQPGE